MEYPIHVNLVKKAPALALGSVLVVTALHGDATELKDNPYKVILDRNPFGLKPPPAIPDQPTTNAVKAEVKFTGITGIAGSKRAWLMIPPGPGRPQPKYLNNLAEGDSDGDIKVVEINDNETTVKILNAGTPLTLNFKDNGLAPPPAPAVPLPGVPGIVPAPGLPNPGVRPVPGMPYVPQPGVTPAVAPVVTPQSSTVAPATAAPVLRTIPARNLRTSPIVQPQADPAVQYLNMKLNEERAKSQGIPYPPTPPIPGAHE